MTPQMATRPSSAAESRSAETQDGVNEKATVQDVTENPHNFKFQEVEAAQVPRTLDDVDAAVINKLCNAGQPCPDQKMR